MQPEQSPLTNEELHASTMGDVYIKHAPSLKQKTFGARIF
jgi:hypothetical protein